MRGFQQLLAQGARQGGAAGEDQAAEAARACEAQWAVHEAVILRVDHAVFQKAPRPMDVLHEASPVVWRVRIRQAERRDVPRQQLGVGGEVQVQFVGRVARRIGDGLEWQPFHACAGGEGDLCALQGGGTVAAIETCRAGRGDERVRALVHAHLHIEYIAAYQSARGMDEHVVADARAFGVEAAQHAQWPVVREVHAGGTRTGLRVVEMETGMPDHGDGFERF